MSKLGSSQPRDAQVVMSLLRDMGVDSYEPEVVSQLIEFSYRYISDVLEDAKAISGHANKSGNSIDGEDVRLAARMLGVERSSCSPPTREVLTEAARVRNNTPLPLPRPTCGLRLPPERHCLLATNYRLRQETQRGRGGVRGGADNRAIVINPVVKQGRDGSGPQEQMFHISVDPAQLQSTPTTNAVKRKASDD